MPDISVSFAGLRLQNPTMLASGILGVTKSSLKYVVEHGAGACVIKSISLEPRSGHAAPNMHPVEGGFLNAVGYSNPGLEEAKREFSSLREVGAPVIASIVGKDADEFARNAEQFLSDEFAAVEAVLSCPHTPGYGTLAGQGSPESTEKITKTIRAKTKLPLFIKLSPQSEPISEVAKAAEAGGADGITAINTAGPGMYIDIKTRSPVLHFGMGGLSGPALRPIAVRSVHDIYKSVKIPIIGVGGIQSGRDAIEMMMAGAQAVQIGTGIYYKGIDVFKQVTDEIRTFMEEEGIEKISEIVGTIHI